MPGEGVPSQSPCRGKRQGGSCDKVVLRAPNFLLSWAMPLPQDMGRALRRLGSIVYLSGVSVKWCALNVEVRMSWLFVTSSGEPQKQTCKRECITFCPSWNFSRTKRQS